MSAINMMKQSINAIDEDVDALFSLFVLLPDNDKHLGTLMVLHDKLDKNITLIKYLVQLLLKREENYDAVRDHLLE